jgi:excisionase family DNA binding protein
MQTPKTISDLPRWLREQFETFQHLDTFGLPDHGDFDGFEAATLVNECQRVACGFGAPLVGDEQTVTSIRAGVETLGHLLAWARDRTAAASPYFDSSAACNYLGITGQSLYGLVERKRLVPLRGPRRTYRFTRKQLDDYLENPTV